MSAPTGLPKLPSAGAVGAEMYRFCSDVVNWLKSQPRYEVRTIDELVTADLPLYVETELEPQSVSIGWMVDIETGAVAASTLAWRKSDDPDQPGLYIDSVTGSGCYKINLVIIGEAD